MTPPYFKVHTLRQLENVQKYVLPEVEQLLLNAFGKMNVEAAERRHAMVRRVINNLYTSCVKSGLQREADYIVHGAKSPMLEEFRKKLLEQGLSSR